MLKPASATALTALRLGELAVEAGYPAGVVNVVPGRGSIAGDALATLRLHAACARSTSGLFASGDVCAFARTAESPSLMSARAGIIEAAVGAGGCGGGPLFPEAGRTEIDDGTGKWDEFYTRQRGRSKLQKP